MIELDGLEYAQARLGARNGDRPNEVDWRHIEVLRELNAVLDAARGTRLRHWTTGIAADDGAHEIDATLRRHWRSLVAELTGWMPPEWRGSMAWCGALIDLPTLQYLARRGKPLAWMRDDPVYREFRFYETRTRSPLLISGPLAPLASAWAHPDRLFHVWIVEWTLRLPRSLAATPLLQRLAKLMEEHLAVFGTADPTESWPLRRALQARLTSLFRCAVLDPSAAFVFLALSALDLERLRGELLRRATFPRSPLAA